MSRSIFTAFGAAVLVAFGVPAAVDRFIGSSFRRPPGAAILLRRPTGDGSDVVPATGTTGDSLAPAIAAGLALRLISDICLRTAGSFSDIV